MKTVYLLIWEPDVKDAGVGSQNECLVFGNRNDAAKFSRANFLFTDRYGTPIADEVDQGFARAVFGEMFEEMLEDEIDLPTGKVEIYSTHIR